MHRKELPFLTQQSIRKRRWIYRSSQFTIANNKYAYIIYNILKQYLVSRLSIYYNPEHKNINKAVICSKKEKHYIIQSPTFQNYILHNYTKKFLKKKEPLFLKFTTFRFRAQYSSSIIVQIYQKTHRLETQD